MVKLGGEVLEVKKRGSTDFFFLGGTIRDSGNSEQQKILPFFRKVAFAANYFIIFW